MSLSLALLTVAALQIPPALEPQPAPRVVMLSPGLSAGHADDEEIVLYFVDEPAGDVESAAALGVGELEPAQTVGLPCPLHATLRSLGRWLLVLVSMVFVAALLGSVGAARRPLPLAAIAVRQPARAVPLVERVLVLACLWSPMLMLLGLLQAEREMLSSVLLCMALVGGASAAAMLAARRRLFARLRWAMDSSDGGRLSTLPDGVVVKAEVDPKRLVAPPGADGPTPWFRADVVVQTAPEGERADGEGARVSLDGALVDDEAARALVRMAMGLPPGTRLTVLGTASRAPADASGAAPLDRVAPTQARIGSQPGARAIVVAGSAARLARRLRVESALLGFALCGSICAALLTLVS
jgi:hypothetical protein